MRMRAGHWIVVWLVALAIRLSAAFMLPNAEGDGYCYAEIIAQLSAKISAGHFRFTDLFGFWLPLFQVTAAIANLWIDNALLAGKIVSALCGATTCVLVFAITNRITRNIGLAYLAFAVITFNPLHVLYSAACMTDVPYGCLVLTSLWFVLKRRWIAATIFAAAAGCVRMEPWALILLLPLIQFLYERRISLVALIILICPPLTWVAISYFATGDAFAYFADRARYHLSYLEFFPTRRGFAWSDIRQDADYLLLAANRVVGLAIIAAAILSILRWVRRGRLIPISLAAPLGYVAAIFGLILVAYATKRQPVILPRYGLIFFLLGLPLLMWMIQFSIKRSPRSWFIKIAATAVICLCLWESTGQLVVISKVLVDFRAHSEVARALVTAMKSSPQAEQRCFSDAAAVRVLSKLPADRFVRSTAAPVSAWRSSTAFESYLEQEHVVYLVFMRVEDSLPAKFCPELGDTSRTKSGKFELMTFAASPFGPDVSLYRLRGAEQTR
jgi:hypothetical protein